MPSPPTTCALATAVIPGCRCMSREFTRHSPELGIVLPSTPCCAGTEPAPMSRPNCPCWQPTWDTVRRCRLIITCNSSNRSAQRPANGSPIITVNWSLRCRNRRGGAYENRASESTRRRNPRLLHGSPSPPSGNQVRTPSTATATALCCCYGFFPDNEISRLRGST